jgi:signal transduction histidine kinase
VETKKGGEDQSSLISRVALVLGHELRNPIAVINNSTYFLRSRLEAQGSLDPKAEKHFGIIASEVDRVNGMIAEIFSYARPLELKLQAASLNTAIDQVLRGYSFPEKIHLDKRLSLEDPQVPLQTEALKEAMWRLLDNAAEAMPSGGKLSIETRVESGRVLLEVKDSGEGFKSEAMESLSEPFFTTKTRGLGLGLAIARRFLEALGARLELSNAQGGGALLRISWTAGT